MAIMCRTKLGPFVTGLHNPTFVGIRRGTRLALLHERELLIHCERSRLPIGVCRGRTRRGRHATSLLFSLCSDSVCSYGHRQKYQYVYNLMSFLAQNAYIHKCLRKLIQKRTRLAFIGVSMAISLLIPAAGLAPAKAGEATLHSFKGDADGQNPQAPLAIDANGALYGTTAAGGTGVGHGGTAFKLTPPTSGTGAWTKTELHGFAAGPHDGAFPAGGLIFDAQVRFTARRKMEAHRIGEQSLN